MTISLITVVRNEETQMKSFLKWHQPWVDEVIVVHDGPCEDATREIALAQRCQYYEVAYEGYCEPHRAWAAARSHGDWLLFADADERFPLQFLQFTREIEKSAAFGGLLFHRTTFWEDAPERPVVNDVQLRFIQRDALKLSPVIHTSPGCTGKVVSFPETFPIVHTNWAATLPEKLVRYRKVIERLLSQSQDDAEKIHLEQCLREMEPDEQFFGIIRDSGLFNTV